MLLFINTNQTYINVYITLIYKIYILGAKLNMIQYNVSISLGIHILLTRY